MQYSVKTGSNAGMQVTFFFTILGEATADKMDNQNK